MRTQQFPLSTLSPQKQRGVVLFIALIVMVAMSLAAIAMFRSVDTANLVAGNQAFKQSALNSTDIGVAAAMSKATWMGAVCPNFCSIQLRRNLHSQHLSTPPMRRIARLPIVRTRKSFASSLIANVIPPRLPPQRQTSIAR